MEKRGRGLSKPPGLERITSTGEDTRGSWTNALTKTGRALGAMTLFANRPGQIRCDLTLLASGLVPISWVGLRPEPLPPDDATVLKHRVRDPGAADLLH